MPVDDLGTFVALPEHPVPPNRVGIDSLAAQIDELQGQSGLKQEAVAGSVGRSSSTVSRIRAGRVKPSVTGVIALSSTYGVSPEEIDRLTELARANKAASKNANRYSSVLSPAGQHYLSYEAAATEVWQYHPATLPGILRTTVSVQTLDEAFYPDRSEEGRTLAVDLQRRRAAYLLGKYGPKLELIVDEAALWRPMGRLGTDRYAQLRASIAALKVLNTAEQKLPPESELNPNIIIRVLRLSASHYVSQFPLHVLRIPGQSQLAAYSATLNGKNEVFTHNPPEPSREELALEALRRHCTATREETDAVLDNLLVSLPE